MITAELITLKMYLMYDSSEQIILICSEQKEYFGRDQCNESDTNTQLTLAF